MICLSLLLTLAAVQQPAAANPAAAEDHARAAWNALQERFSAAAAVSFEANGEYLSTSATHAGRTLANIHVNVGVARPGFGEVHVTARAEGAPANAAVNASCFGTAEGIWSVAHGSDRAFGCGGDWNGSTELDDFTFLGAAWSGWCARRGEADEVSFVPAHAEHPGLTGLRVRWNGDENEGHRSTIFWLDGEGEVHSADVRIDAETVLHWNFTNFDVQTEFDAANFVAVLPNGFVREGFGVAEASANGEVGLTGDAPATIETREPSPIEEVVEQAIENAGQNGNPVKQPNGANHGANQASKNASNPAKTNGANGTKSTNGTNGAQGNTNGNQGTTGATGTNEPKPVTNEPKPVTNEPKPATNEPKPVTNEPKPKSDD